MIASTARSTRLSSQTTSIFTFGQEVHHVFGAAIELGMAFLPAEALRLDDSDALQPNLVQRLLHFVQLERLDDRLDLLHLVHAGPGPTRPPLCSSDSTPVTPPRAAGGQARVSQRADIIRLARAVPEWHHQCWREP